MGRSIRLVGVKKKEGLKSSSGPSEMPDGGGDGGGDKLTA